MAGKVTDLTGQKFNKLLVIGRAEDRFAKSGKRRVYWNCLCECGTELEVRQDGLKKNDSCGCTTVQKAYENIKFAQAVGYKTKPQDLTGKKFGRLTVIEQAEYTYTPSDRALVRWNCYCSCGNFVNHLGDSLRQGKAVSCGCVNINFVDSDLQSPQEVFIYKAKLVHGDKYSYENVVYTGSLEKVIVSCPEHGDFQVQASNHIQGGGCKWCFFESQAQRHHFNYKRKCELYPEFSEREGCVYVLKMKTENEEFIKVGVSCSFDKRISSYKTEGLDVEIIETFPMKNYKCAILEISLLRMIQNSGLKYKPETSFAGYTECSVLSGKEAILNFIREYDFGNADSTSQ